MRRGSIVALLGLALIAGGVATAVALVPTWLPEDASREAGRIAFTFWFVIAICIFIFSIVAAVMVYEVLKFRVREDDFEDGPPIHGHTGLEITWTIIPFILVTAIAIVSAIVLSRNDAQAKDTLRINVLAQQFEFTFSYPDAKNVTSPVLMLPKDRSVELYMRSLDVIHSVFVPQFSQKEDIVPGLVTQLHITPTRLGTFPLECTELCGLGHSLMRTQAVVVEPAAFNKWLKRAGEERGTGATDHDHDNGDGHDLDHPDLVLGGRPHGLQPERLLELPHADRGQGNRHVGPDLDKLAAYARQAKQPLEPFIHESIVDPNAYIQPGYPKSVMPETFGQNLTKEQLDHLVAFLVESAQAKKG